MAPPQASTENAFAKKAFAAANQQVAASADNSAEGLKKEAKAADDVKGSFADDIAKILDDEDGIGDDISAIKGISIPEGAQVISERYDNKRYL